jgi:hypothetical protein
MEWHGVTTAWYTIERALSRVTRDIHVLRVTKLVWFADLAPHPLCLVQVVTAPLHVR